MRVRAPFCCFFFCRQTCGSKCRLLCISKRDGKHAKQEGQEEQRQREESHQSYPNTIPSSSGNEGNDVQHPDARNSRPSKQDRVVEEAEDRGPTFYPGS